MVELVIYIRNWIGPLSFLRAKTTLQSISYDSVEAYYHSVSQMTWGDVSQLISKDFKELLDSYQPLHLFEEVASSFNGSNDLNLIQHLDFHTWLPGDILVKTDRCSMAHGLEVRVPLSRS